MGCDVSSSEGFARIDESDIVAAPDPATFQLLPWRPPDRPVGRLFCNICTHRPREAPYERDLWHALKRMLNRMSEKGYPFYVGPALKYFYFKSDSAPESLDRVGYFDITPLDRGGELFSSLACRPPSGSISA
jgi:glutamine synthetase